MSLMKWVEKKTKRFTAWDFAILKVGLIAFGMVLGAYLTSFVKQYVWIFVSLWVVAWVYLWIRIFKK